MTIYKNNYFNFLIKQIATLWSTNDNNNYLEIRIQYEIKLF